MTCHFCSFAISRQDGKFESYPFFIFLLSQFTATADFIAQQEADAVAAVSAVVAESRTTPFGNQDQHLQRGGGDGASPFLRDGAYSRASPYGSVSGSVASIQDPRASPFVQDPRATPFHQQEVRASPYVFGSPASSAARSHIPFSATPYNEEVRATHFPTPGSSRDPRSTPYGHLQGARATPHGHIRKSADFYHPYNRDARASPHLQSFRPTSFRLSPEISSINNVQQGGEEEAFVPIAGAAAHAPVPIRPNAMTGTATASMETSEIIAEAGASVAKNKLHKRLQTPLPAGSPLTTGTNTISPANEGELARYVNSKTPTFGPKVITVPAPTPMAPTPMAKIASGELAMPTPTPTKEVGRPVSARSRSVSGGSRTPSPVSLESVQRILEDKDLNKRLLLHMAMGSRDRPNGTKSPTNNYPSAPVISDGFFWKDYPILESILYAHMTEYYELSINRRQSKDQQRFNNNLVELVRAHAAEQGWTFDPVVFDDKKLRDRIRCFFKTHIQNAKKRLNTMLKKPDRYADQLNELVAAVSDESASNSSTSSPTSTKNETKIIVTTGGRAITPTHGTATVSS